MEGFLEEAVDEFGNGVGVGLPLLGRCGIPGFPRGGQGWPTSLPTTSCCTPLWPPVTSTSLAKPQENISGSSAPGPSVPRQPPPNSWGLGGQCLQRRKSSLVICLDQSLGLHLTIAHLSHTQAFARCFLCWECSPVSVHLSHRVGLTHCSHSLSLPLGSSQHFAQLATISSAGGAIFPGDRSWRRWAQMGRRC